MLKTCTSADVLEESLHVFNLKGFRILSMVGEKCLTPYHSSDEKNENYNDVMVVNILSRWQNVKENPA